MLAVIRGDTEALSWPLESKSDSDKLEVLKGVQTGWGLCNRDP